MDYQPKKGDRVRATREGVVTMVGHDLVEIDGEALWAPHYNFEKLADPEPEWVNGDVVKVGGWKLGYFFYDTWYSADRKPHIFSGAGGSAVTLSDYWKRGEVTILVKDGKATREEVA